MQSSRGEMTATVALVIGGVLLTQPVWDILLSCVRRVVSCLVRMTRPLKDIYHEEEETSTPEGSDRCAPDEGRMAVLGSLAMEVAFPVCGLWRMGESDLIQNEESLRKLVEGSIFRGDGGWGSVTAGSRAEGLGMEEYWGQGWVDEDVMMLYGGGLGVEVLVSEQSLPEGTSLLYRCEGCPPAYTRIEVRLKDKLLQAIRSCMLDESLSDDVVQQCVSQEDRDGRRWLQPHQLLTALKFPDGHTIQGPAAVARAGMTSLMERVVSLVCSGPHPAMSTYTRRTRGHWPSNTQLDDLLLLPMILVCVGPKGHPEAGQMFRLSWSPQEMRLFGDLALWLKHGYVVFKYTVKSLLKSAAAVDDGRSRVGSFHMKTVFLRYLEEHPPAQEGSSFQLMLDLCQDLRRYLRCGRLPHYFLPACDLLQTVGITEREDAIHAVNQVLDDPLTAILRSPPYPKTIFGSRKPGDLLRCMQELQQEPTELQGLLQYIDKKRKRSHRQQTMMDRIWRVSGRPGLMRLADHCHDSCIC